MRLALAAMLLVAALPAVGAAAANDDEQACLALALYFEAEAEGRAGMEAVAAVVLNRIADPEFPDTACAVVGDGGETPPCQFRWWCDGKSDQPENQDADALAREVARAALTDPPPDSTGGALFFHSTDVEPDFGIERERTVTIGNHVFYR